MPVRYISTVLLIITLCLGSLGQEAGGAAVKDAESASHGDEASTYKIVNTYTYPGCRLVQFTLGVLSHYSYVLLSGNQALVVDPGRDVFAYLELAKKENVKIMGVYLTHNHADFVAGHLELARAVGCPVFASAQSKDEFPHKPLQEGSKIEVGEMVIKILETPGHTPDGTCGLVAPSNKPENPLFLLTGDTLFIGSVGRPDLMGGSVSAGALASMMFDTWTKKLSNLPDNLGIFPAHGAGSLCGAHLSDDPTSTLGVQRTANSYLKHQNRGDFVAAVLEGLPEAPQYFKHNAAMNKKGPALVNWQAEPRPQRPEKTLTDPKRFFVVDVRPAKDYASGHIPNSINIAVRGRLETWVGIMVPWGARLVLCGSPPEVKEAAQRLHRVGYKAEALTPGAWLEAGFNMAQNELVSPPDLYAQMQTRESPLVVDVRLPNEWMGLRIGMAVNLPLTHLSELAPNKLDPAQKVVTVCNSAFRSSLAVGLLERLGFTKIASLDGGSEAWIAAGLPTLGPEGKTRAASLTSSGVTAALAPKRDLRLPERISSASLQRLVLDLPNTFDLVDLRPAEAFADYHLDGSRQADIGEVIQNPTYLTGAVPLILVDRDGSLAMAVGGILSQKTSRPIKVLHGGLEAYWMETELKGAVRETPITGTPQMRLQPVPTTPAPAGPPPAAPSSPPATPKKKSAGC